MNDTTRRAFLQTSSIAAAALALRPELAFGSFRAKEPVSIGLIGAGRQGRSILAELTKMENIAIKAICDTDQSRLDAAMRRARGAESFNDYRALLDRADLSAVIIATPTHIHREPAIAAIESGKYVYCEAPLASTIDDARAIAQAARNNTKTVVHVGMQGRSNPVYNLAWSFMRSGAIRDLVEMRAQYHEKTSWRFPAPDPALEKERNWRLDPEVSIGLAGEIGAHQFDIAHWFVNRYPKSVRGWGSVQLHKDGREIADTVQAVLDFGDGVRLMYDATLANSYGDQYELIHGTMGAFKLAWTHGWLFKEADAPTQGWEVYANRQQFHNEEGITLIADATQLAAQGRLKEGVGLPQTSLYYALEDFIKSVSEGAPVACTASEGLRAAIVGISVNEAITKGGEVAIDQSQFAEG